MMLNYNTIKKVLFLPFLLSVAACATQAQLIDLERSVTKLNYQQEAVFRELKTLEESAKLEGAFVGDKNVLEFLRKLSDLELAISSNSGLWEENSNLVSEISQRLDDFNNKISDLSARVQTVEIGIVSLEKSDQGGASGVVVMHDSVHAVKSDKMVIPGRLPGGGMTSVEAYNLAYRDYVRGNYDMTLQGFENFIKTYPDSSLAHQAQYWIGDAYYEKKEYQKSIAAFEQLIALYPDSDKIVTALLKESFALLEMGDVVKAEEYLKQIIERYPYAKEAKLAKEKLSELR